MASYHTGVPDSVYMPPPPPSPHHVTTLSTDINKIRDWLPWSIINIFLSWGIGGIIPLIFTMLCRQNKRNNELHGAQTMSKLSLIFNIIATLSGIAGWVSLIILLLSARRIIQIYSPK